MRHLWQGGCGLRGAKEKQGACLHSGSLTGRIVRPEIEEKEKRPGTGG
jgi:hypothetical protein